MTNNLIGKRACIKTKKGDTNWNNEYRGTYGVICHYDGEYYHIQMFCNEPSDTENALIFERNEFTVRRS